jgi:PAS domain S-box-containing protein
VLIVEDSEDDVLLLLRRLRRGGYEPAHRRVETREEMEEALAAAEWDVILSDHRVARFGSFEALKLARKEGSEAPFIVVSGRIGEAIAVELMKAGAYDYVTKEDLTRLCATVEHALEEAGERRERRRAEEEVRQRDAILEAVRYAADRLLGESTGWEEGVRAVLRRLGEATGASRVYVFENETAEDGALWNVERHKWVAPGVAWGVPNPSDGSPVSRFPYRAAGFGSWMELLGRGQPVYGLTRDFPGSERPLLVEALGVLSVALVPIFVAGRWWGFIGFDECGKEREWSVAEVGALGAAAGTLGAAIRRRQIEEELRTSEAELRAVFGAMNDLVLVLDGEGRYLKVAPTTFTMLYRPPEELVGRTIHDTFPREQADMILGSLRRSLETRERVDIEYGLRVLGRDMWFSATISPMTEDSVVAVARDITERKQNEVALRQSEELYRTVIEQTTENIFLVDVETRRIVESNAAFREALGYSEEELAAMTIYDIVADPESVDENVRRVSEERSPDVGERRYRRKDGTLLHVEVSASTILHNGRETLCVVAHDVTERARAQRLLEERVATLSRISADLTLDLPMQDTLDAVAENVVNASTAVSGTVILVNEETGFPRIEGSYGLPEGFKEGIEAVWQNASVLRSPTLEAIRTRRPALDSHMPRRMLENPLYAPVHDLVREVEWDAVFIVPLVSRGRTLGVLTFGYPEGQQPGEDEKVFLGTVADQAAVAVENVRLFSKARGKAALEERQKLARELHDSVSQTLYGIALSAKAVRQELGDGPAEVVEPLDYVLSLSEAGMAEMRALIFELRPESLETEGLVAALEKQAAALQTRHGIRVETDLCDEPETPLEAKEALYRIAQEALHNTVKHARAKRVGLRMTCASKQIMLEISDEGLGFDPTEDFPGHLGLDSMRERASRLGGTLEIYSSLGHGTRILARIPSGY